MVISTGSPLCLCGKVGAFEVSMFYYIYLPGPTSVTALNEPLVEVDRNSMVDVYYRSALAESLAVRRTPVETSPSSVLSILVHVIFCDTVQPVYVVLFVIS